MKKSDAIRADYGAILEHSFLVDYDGSPSKCRVTGACKTWKRTPEKFKLPVKRGLYEYFYISENNGNQWDFSK